MVKLTKFYQVTSLTIPSGLRAMVAADAHRMIGCGVVECDRCGEDLEVGE